MDSPLVLKTVAEMRAAVAQARQQGKMVSLVPTMGALHEGHLSLIQSARAKTGFVVVSIFVNPTQFGPHEDFNRYPRPFAQDLALCQAEGVNAVFHPEASVLYPSGYRTFVEVHQLQDVLCGASRPGHFRGVATVVLKLFNIVQPDVAYFGQKDAQQARIIQQMVHDLDLPVLIRIGPIVREADGLALSSRNRYLDQRERSQAPVLHQALEEVRQRIKAGERDAQALIQMVKEKIPQVAQVAQSSEARLDYVAVVDFETLQPLERLHGQVLVALAVFFGSTRLIDNILLTVERS